MCDGFRPLIVDEQGSGLHEHPDGRRAFIDREHPEGRWIRWMTEASEAEAAWREREEEIERDREAQRDRWAEEDDEWPWRKRERPSGLMYGLAQEPAP